MAKPKEKIKARKLRKNGESIKEIANILSVSPGSVSLWCRDIELSKHQIDELERRYRDPYYGRRMQYVRKQQEKRRKRIEFLKRKGIQKVGKLSNRELFLVGVSLYWSEGFKKDSQAGFANSDPKMINVFLQWLKKCCDYDIDDLILRVTLNKSHSHRVKEVQKYWSKKTGVPLSSFQKPYFQRVKWKKVYENPNNYYGVLRIRVRKSTDFLREIHGWIEGLGLLR